MSQTARHRQPSFLTLASALALALAAAPGALQAPAGAITLLEVQRNGQGGVAGLEEPRGTVVSPDGRHLYAFCNGSQGDGNDSIVVFARSAVTGRLTWLDVHRESTIPVYRVAPTNDLAFSPDGRHLYATDPGDNQIDIYSRSAIGGRLAYRGFVRNDSGGVQGLALPGSLAVSPDGRNVYVVARGDIGGNPSALVVFSRDAESGLLAYRSRYTSGGGVLIDGLESVAVSADGQNVYAAAGSPSRAVTSFRRDAVGLLHFLDSQSFTVSPLGHSAVTVARDGRHVYSQSDGSEIMVWERNGSGRLRSRGTARVSNNTTLLVLAVDPRGDQVFALQEGISVLERHAATGTLSERDAVEPGGPGFDLGTGAGSLSPDGRHAYFVDSFEDELITYDLARPTTVLLQRSRFRVSARFTSGAGSGAAVPAALTPDTATFWFFDPANVELVVKVLDGCGLNQRYWVFLSGLTNVEVEVTVTDRATSETVVYRSPQGAVFSPRLDTAAFATCP